MSNVDFELIAEKRDDKGKGASRRLRRAGKVPAILYGGGKDPLPLNLDHNALIKNLEHEAFYSHILTVKLDGGAEKAILRDIQRHPYKPTVLHVDLLRVSEDQKIRVHVPLHFLNEESCVGVKTSGGTIAHTLAEVEVECLPRDLPEYIAVDLANVNVGETIHLSNLELSAGVALVQLMHEHDLPVVSVHKPRGAAEETTEGAPEA
ncbi:MAG: 50S ribosomal protein L25/general stress protein Ctc [Chromatiales bacterium]|jgi:large subunit ribosomal protein L25|nr:50S ribosomal protein L25/general stress protein Ctc [Chromatiales bacterium]MDX9767021.1 50S ribosomal protein L25/general stress protein Ctc [Ectothiorhodospiraceae bacterium]